jgi:hypothetical protein
MIPLILGALAVVLIIFLIAAALQPTDFTIVRRTTISAPATVVFPYVNDLHLWQQFSPWVKLDPHAKNTYEGPPAGVGASFSWAGNSKIGAGRMTITESKPVEVVRMRLEFLKPFVATNAVEFALQPSGNQTTITWSMAGRRNFVMKAFGLLLNMDTMVGGDFEKGLATLKALCETADKK